MNYAIGMANAIKGMESELIELRAKCKQQEEELERYRTKEALEKLSLAPVAEVKEGTLDELMGEEEDEE